MSQPSFGFGFGFGQNQTTNQHKSIQVNKQKQQQLENSSINFNQSQQPKQENKLNSSMFGVFQQNKKENKGVDQQIPFSKKDQKQELDQSWLHLKKEDKQDDKYNHQTSFVIRRDCVNKRQENKDFGGFGEENQSFLFENQKTVNLKQKVDSSQTGGQKKDRSGFEEVFGFSNKDGFGMQANKNDNVNFQQPQINFKKKQGFGFQSSQGEQYNRFGGNNFRVPRQGQQDNYGGYRGGRGRGRGRGRGGFGSSFGGFNNERNFNSGFGNFGGGFNHDRNSNPSFGNQNFGFNQNSNFNKNNNFNQPINEKHSSNDNMSNNGDSNKTSPVFQNINESVNPVSPKIIKVGQFQEIPQRFLCWPKAQIYAMGKEISFTQRPLYQHSNSDILIIPFYTTKLELYGGNLVAACSTDYRKKIKQKIDKGLMSYGGDPYFQKVVGNINFKVFAFIYIDPNNIKDNLLSSLQKMFVILKNNPKQLPQQKIIIPICMQLKPFSEYFDKVIECVEGVTGVKRVCFSMKDQGCFKEFILNFADLYQKYRQANMISLE